MVQKVLTDNFLRETPDIETSSDGYATRFSGSIGEWFLRVQQEATLKMIAERPGTTILDVGGGHGQLTAPLIDSGYRLTVLGSAPECQKRIQGYVEQGRCRFAAGDILNMPFKDRSYDVVISFRLISHLQQWQRMLCELTRVARHTVIIDYPSKRSLNYLTPMLFKVKKNIEGNTRSYTLFREAEVLEVFKKAGFVKENASPEFFIPMVLHRILKCTLISAFLENLCRTAGCTAALGSPVILKMIRNGGEER